MAASLRLATDLRRTSTDRTSDLRSLVDAARAKLGQEEVTRLLAEGNAARKKRKVGIDPFAASLQQVMAMYTSAMASARVAICNAVSAMDDVEGTSVHRAVCSDALVVSDASLLAASTAVAQLSSAVERAEKQLARRTSHNEGRELIEHTFNAATALADSIGRRRIAVALAREDMDRHRTLLLNFSKAGVLVCPGADQQRALLSEEAQRKVRRAAPPPMSGANISAKATAASRRAVEGARSLAENTTAQMLSFGAKAKAAIDRTAMRAAGDGDDTRQSKTGAGGGSSSCAFTENIERTLAVASAGRREELQQEQTLLQSRQQRSSVAAARQIEAAVQEVSVINAIMREQIALQAEQITLAERNTADSKASLRAATDQLRQPVRAKWNAKRTLTSVLVACSIALLTANAIIR